MAFPRLIDLTLPLTPGQRGVSSEPKYTFARDGWNVAVENIDPSAVTSASSLPASGSAALLPPP